MAYILCNREASADSAMTTSFPIEGGCDCGTIRYRMTTEPLIVHCCHCRWCQRETGSAFVLNAAIESDRFINLGDGPLIVDTPSASGMGQKIARCPQCYVAVWSHYAGSGELTKYVRVGTLDQPDLLPPDVHIFTASKQPWIIIPDAMMAFEEYYDRKQVWRDSSLARYEMLKPKIDAYRASLNG